MVSVNGQVQDIGLFFHPRGRRSTFCSGSKREVVLEVIFDGGPGIW